MAINKGSVWIVEELLDGAEEWSVTTGVFGTQAEAELIERLWQQGADGAEANWKYRTRQYIRVEPRTEIAEWPGGRASAIPVGGVIQTIDAPVDGDVVLDVGSLGIFTVRISGH